MKEQLRKRMGAYVQGLRKDLGITQRSLSDACGWDYYTYVSQIERGRDPLPEKDVATAADILNVPRYEFARTLLAHYHPDLYLAMYGGVHPEKWRTATDWKNHKHDPATP